MRLGKILCMCLLCFSNSIWAQKKLIDNNSYKNWEALSEYAINNSGTYCWYGFGTDEKKRFELYDVVRKTKTLISNFNGADPHFTNDSQKIIYMTTGDSLIVQNLNSNVRVVIPDVNYIQKVTENNSIGLIFTNTKKGTKVFSFDGKLAQQMENAQELVFNEQSTMILMKQNDSLSLISVPGFKNVRSFGKGDFSLLRFDKSGNQVAFMNKVGGNIEVFYYNRLTDVLNQFDDKKLLTKEKNLQLSNNVLQFSKDGNHLFLNLLGLKDSLLSDTDIITTHVDIWHYKDRDMQSSQMEMREPNFYLAALRTKGDFKLKILERGDQVAQDENTIPNTIILVSKKRNQDGEAYFKPAWKSSYGFTSLGDPELKYNELGETKSVLSPEEKYITWFEGNHLSLVCYDVANSRKRIIKLPFNAVSENFAWSKNDKYCFINDGFDIWKINPLGNEKIVSITNQYGRSHGISFDFTASSDYPRVINYDEKQIFLRAQDSAMSNGFWTIGLKNLKDPIKFKMGNVFYDWDGGVSSRPIVKAKLSNLYLLTGQNASEAPNLYLTDFKSNITKLSNISPQQSYNWLTSELINYKLSDGRRNKAILYKPENFDPLKSYPIIFHYYQERSNELLKFLKPELSSGALSIPWYVSNGYIVCVPDILNDQKGKIARTSVDAVESAAKYLCQFPWINGKKMGLQGHSFGGYETNYIIAGSSLFAAAQSSAGVSDAISAIGNIRFGGRSLYWYWEKGQANMGIGNLPWSNPESYIESTVIFRANKIITPLLLHNNKGDGQQFFQGLELYSALRRLGKPVWMLQYDLDGHVLVNKESMLDFTIRQQQFFDHYLKDKPAPIWMTEGIPFNLKGIRSGLALDSQGKQP